MSSVFPVNPMSGPADPSTMSEDGQLKCAVMVKENRRYYLDLKENNRGRFLRVPIPTASSLTLETDQLYKLAYSLYFNLHILTWP